MEINKLVYANQNEWQKMNWSEKMRARVKIDVELKKNRRRTPRTD